MNDDEKIVGKRAKQTKQLIDMALKCVVDGWSYKNFEQSFPRAAKDSPETLKAMRDQTMEYFETSVKTSIENLHKRRNVVGRLNELDNMLDKVQLAKKENSKEVHGMSYKNRGEAFANDPFLAVRARRHAILAKENERVNNELISARSENEVLINKLKDTQNDLVNARNDQLEIGNIINLLSNTTESIPIDEMSVLINETKIEIPN